MAPSRLAPVRSPLLCCVSTLTLLQTCIPQLPDKRWPDNRDKAAVRIHGVTQATTPRQDHVREIYRSILPTLRAFPRV